MSKEALTEADLIEGLADSLVVGPWRDDNDIDSFVTCWVALGRTLNLDRTPLSPAVSVALSCVCFSIASSCREESSEMPALILQRVIDANLNHRFGIASDEVSAFVIDSFHRLLVDAEKESQDRWFKGWDILVWEDGDYDNEIDRVAMDAVIATMARIFATFIVAFSPETRAEIRDHLHEYAALMGDETGDDESDMNIDAPGIMSNILDSQVNEKTQARESNAPTVRQNSRIVNRPMVSSDELWALTYQSILTNRDHANAANGSRENRGKPYYANDGANLLAEAVARVLHMQPIPKGMTPRDWAMLHPEQVVVLDARDVVLHVRDSLANAPQTAIKNRLAGMANYFPQAAEVGVWRNMSIGQRSILGELIDSRFVVILFRKN